jgi:hypothetical protein
MPIRRLWRKSDMRGSKRKNTKRENRLEELGRVDAEKAYTAKGKKNLSEEKSRIRKELATGSRPKWPKGYDPRKQMDPKDFLRRPEKSRIRTEITDPQRKKDLRRKLKPLPTPPSRKLTPEQRERIKKHLLKTGRPKIATKGWK